MPKEPVDISKVFEEGTLIDEAMQRSLYMVVEQHRRAGLPLAVAENGNVVWISAEEALRRLQRGEHARQKPTGDAGGQGPP